MTDSATPNSTLRDFSTRGADRRPPNRGDNIYDKKKLSQTKLMHITNPFTGVQHSFAAEQKRLDAHELEKSTAKAEDNPRELEDLDITKRDTFMLLQNDGVMTHSAIGFVIEGSEDKTIYLIDGWTRRCSIVNMYNKSLEEEQGHSFKFKFPVDILTLKPEDIHWVATALVFKVTSATEHSIFEKCDLMINFYKQYVKNDPECRVRHTWDAVSASATNTPSYSQFISMLVCGALRKILLKRHPELLKKLKSLNDYKKAIEWIVKQTNSGDGKQSAASLLQDNSSCVKDPEAGLLSKIEGDLLNQLIGKLEDSANAKEAFNSTPENSQEKAPRPPLVINSEECVINLNMNRSDLSPESMKLIKEVFEANKPVLDALIAKVEAIYKAEQEGQSKTN